MNCHAQDEPNPGLRKLSLLRDHIANHAENEHQTEVHEFSHDGLLS